MLFGRNYLLIQSIIKISQYYRRQNRKFNRKPVPLMRLLQLYQLRIVRYAFVGFIAFFFDFGLLVLLTEALHLHYLVSAAISFLLGFLINYLLSMKFVFQDLTSRPFCFPLYFLIALIGLVLNELIMWFFTDIMLQYYIHSKLIAVFTVFFWNYLARRYFCFKEVQV